MSLKLLFLALAAAALHAQNLMPWPAQIQTGHGRFPIEQGFRVTFTGYREPRLEAAAGHLLAAVARKTGVPMAGEAAAPELAVECGRASAPVQSMREDESYRLVVSSQQARLTAANPLGVLRGMATFLQLVQPGAGLPAVTIEDRPRFPWRGLLIDVARHWMPEDVIKRNLDAMAAVKLNVLHWHLSDDQGFRIESKRFPKLQGAASDGKYFTQAQVRGIIAYARERGIRVIPEFDMPGHTTSWLVAYPELASAPGPYRLQRTWGIFDPTFDPTKEELYTFLDGFIGEMAALFSDEYFHIGGDENNGKQWNANPRIQEFKRAHGVKTNEDLQAYFNKRVLAIVQKHGKKMIGWDEVLHPDLPRDIVVHSWRGQKSLSEAARMGFSGILSSGYYLDLMQHASEHYAVDPMEGPTAGLTPEQQARILGGEACMWAEMVTAENLEERIWPRMAAIAERLWSPHEVKDVQSMYRRMEVVSRDLDFLGVRHLSAYEQMVARLAWPHDPRPVRVLADAVEPVKGYARSSTGKYTQSTPLNRLVDTARPESEVARRFEAAVDRLLSSHQDTEEVRRQLIVWRDNDAQLPRTPLLAEATPVSEDLSALAAAALEAVDAIAAGRHPDPARYAELLNRAAQARAEVLLSPLAGMKKLIEAAR